MTLDFLPEYITKGFYTSYMGGTKKAVNFKSLQPRGYFFPQKNQGCHLYFYNTLNLEIKVSINEPATHDKGIEREKSSPFRL